MEWLDEYVPICPGEPHPTNGILLKMADGVVWPETKTSVSLLEVSIPLRSLRNCQEEKELGVQQILLNRDSHAVLKGMGRRYPASS
jgi:hypothetical protein